MFMVLSYHPRHKFWLTVRHECRCMHIIMLYHPRYVFWLTAADISQWEVYANNLVRLLTVNWRREVINFMQIVIWYHSRCYMCWLTAVDIERWMILCKLPIRFDITLARYAFKLTAVHMHQWIIHQKSSISFDITLAMRLGWQLYIFTNGSFIQVVNTFWYHPLAMRLDWQL